MQDQSLARRTFPMHERTRRRWFRFSLRTLLVATLVFGAVMGWVVKERRQSEREGEVAKELLRAGCTVEFAGPYDTIEVHYEEKPQTWWRRWARGVLGQRIIRLGVSDAGFERLPAPADLSNLQRVDVEKADDAKLVALSKYSTIRGLDVSMSSVKDIKPLAKLENLTVLWIFRTDIRDLRLLARLKNLEVLGIEETAVEELTPLEGLSNLRRLYLEKTKVTKAQVDGLQKKLPNCVIYR